MPPREILWNNERAGGERGFPRAGVAARGQKAECPRALRPRVKRLPYLIRRSLNAGRANVKKRYKRLSFAQAPQKGCGGKASPFAKATARQAGAFPRGAPEARHRVRGEAR